MIIMAKPNGTANRNHARLMRSPCVTEPNLIEVKTDSSDHQKHDGKAR